MQFFIDTADIEQIKEAFSWGIMDGITTNPSLIKKAAQQYHIHDMGTYIEQILDIAGKMPVSLEVECCTVDDMYSQAKQLWRRFHKKNNNIVIKIPIDPSIHDDSLHFDGIKVVRKLSLEGIPTNVTLAFTPEQALLAAKAGATYISPFVGRIDDKIRSDHGISFDKHDYFPAQGYEKDGHILEDNGIVSGVDLIDHIVTMFSQYNIDTKVLAASLRNPRQVREVALAGADVATIPMDTLREMIKHAKTEQGMENFVKDVVPEYTELLGGR